MHLGTFTHFTTFVFETNWLCESKIKQKTMSVACLTIIIITIILKKSF